MNHLKGQNENCCIIFQHGLVTYFQRSVIQMSTANNYQLYSYAKSGL